jgi:predicted N-acetyltransferase YhbS
MTTVEELIQRVFAVPLTHCTYEFDRYDREGCVGHVGMDERWVEFDATELEDVRSWRLKVAAIRFVVTREDCRHQGVGTELMCSAHQMAARKGLDFAVLFTDLPEFYEHLTYEMVRPRAMVLGIKGYPWPPYNWWPVGSEW